MGGVGEPDGSSVEKYGSDDGFVCDDYGFLLLAPVGATKSFENVEAGGDAGDEIVNVWAEGEVGVESDPHITDPPIIDVCPSGYGVCLITPCLGLRTGHGRKAFASVPLQRKKTAWGADFLCHGLLNLKLLVFQPK